MYILLSTPAAFILLVYSIYKWIMRQSDREKEFWIDQKVYGHPVSLKLYALIKAVLFLIAIGGIMLILVSLVYGQVPTWRVPVLSADRNHHRHIARWNLHRRILIYLPSAGASGRNICRSVTSVRTFI